MTPPDPERARWRDLLHLLRDRPAEAEVAAREIDLCACGDTAHALARDLSARMAAGRATPATRLMALAALAAETMAEHGPLPTDAGSLAGFAMLVAEHLGHHAPAAACQPGAA